MKIKKITICLITFLIIISLSACGNNLSDRRLREILNENGYEFESSKIETILDLKKDTQGLDRSDNNKLVLVNNDDCYGFVIVNTETKKLVVPIFGYIPLNVVQQEIWNSDKDTNVKNIAIFKKYIEQYGVNALENKEYAEEYLREITGTNGIISTEKAKNIISNSTMKIFPNIKSNDDVTVLFEENNAVPIYYTMQSSEMVYNWSSLWAENYYDFVRSSLDKNTLSRIAAIYGPPYVSKTVWAVVDSDLNEVGTYNSLEDVKKELLQNTKTKSGTTIVYKLHSDNPQNDIQTAKEKLMDSLKNLGFVNAKTEIKGDDKIEVTLPMQDNITHMAEMLNFSDKALKFTDYKKNILLTGNDISAVSAGQDESGSYYIKLNFTKQGQDKFKQATSEVSQIPIPNNYIQIMIDDNVISAPHIAQEINTDSCTINGDFTQDEAESLETQLHAALCEFSLEIVETR